MPKIARQVRQAILMGGSGPVPNRLPHEDMDRYNNFSGGWFSANMVLLVKFT